MIIPLREGGRGTAAPSSSSPLIVGGVVVGPTILGGNAPAVCCGDAHLHRLVVVAVVVAVLAVVFQFSGWNLVRFHRTAAFLRSRMLLLMLPMLPNHFN